MKNAQALIDSGLKDAGYEYGESPRFQFPVHS